MILREEILRIRNLIYENELGYEISHDGEINDGFGLVITIRLPEGEVGKISLLNLDSARKYDFDIVDFEINSDIYCKSNCKQNHFTNDNTIYSHSLEVNKPYRGLGYGTKLKEEIENVARQMGYKYILSIVNCDNIESQGLNKKFGYRPHQSNGIKDFLFKELD